MISTVLNAGSFFLDIAKQLYPESGDIGAAAKVTDRAKQSYNVVSTNSVHRSASRALFAPMVGIDESLLHQEYMPDLMSVLMLRDIVATLTHLALQSPAGVGVKVENIIGSVNPVRGGFNSLFSGLESLDTSIKEPETSREGAASVGSKTYTDMLEYTPLALGKVVNATVYLEGGGKLDIPLTFRPVPVPASPENMRITFGAAKGDEGWVVRGLMRKGRVITNPEWFNGTDIVKERFKAKRGDTTGYYKEAMKRDTNNQLTAIRTGQLSMNSMANAWIISQEEATQLELTMGRRFSDPSARQKIFENVSANTVVIVNGDRGIFTFYTDGQTMPEVYTQRDLVIKAKKEGTATNLNDLVKLLNGGM